MDNVSPEIRALQQAYAVRPFAVCWCDSHCSGTFRFHTFNDAFDYVQTQWARITRDVAENPYCASKLRQSHLETPEGKTPLTYVLLTDEVSSY